ncbi:MAG: hypothetical protein EBX40_01965 [Gammaproteobacteria bacterium]|nr:hypothetical protein [Gammaproteobacteria bacterium]
MRFSIKNIPIEKATYDSGWIEHRSGRCWTVWRREIHATTPPHEIIELLEREGDHPGWTGVQYCLAFSEGEKMIFDSTYDSSD